MPNRFATLATTMQPTLQTIASKKLVGHRIRMTLLADKTLDLWSNFMPKRKHISNHIGEELYSIQILSPIYFQSFNPRAEFDKWAAVEVANHDTLPDSMQPITIPSGLYAVFVHKGRASDGPKTFQYIFGTWLPSSDYLLDDRPHFAVMGANYKHNDPESEEEIWVPVTVKP